MVLFFYGHFMVILWSFVISDALMCVLYCFAFLRSAVTVKQEGTVMVAN